MAKKFRSLRKKLVIKLGLTYLFALLFIMLLIILKNALDFKLSIAETESRARAALTNKGMLLIENNSNALIGLVDDNAFSAVEQIITKTVQSDEDIVYGIFTDIDYNNWVYSLKNDAFQSYRPVLDANVEWAFEQKNATSTTLYFDTVQIIEFAAPVISIDQTQLGVIRYGLSTVLLTETIKEANKKATQSLILITIGLFIVSVITLLVTYWRTDKVAKRITVPLNLLTDAAGVIANGDYDQKINVRTNDEIGILADNFNLMTDTINRTIGDLAEINHIGSELAKTRDEISAFQWVLRGILQQLGFQIGLIFRYDKNQEIELLTSYQTDQYQLSDIIKLINDHQPVQAAMTRELPNQLSFQLPDNGDYPYQSLIIMPFGVQNDIPLVLTLLSKNKQRHIENSEIEFCQSIRQLLMTSLKNISMNALLEEQNRTLEDKVAHRTQELKIQNSALSETLKELEQTQTQLVEAEKMASLGSLVAGISHEVNTPLGVSVTAASHLKEQTSIFENKFNQGALTKSGFINYLGGASEASEIILTNLERAATLIQSFKQIAVDQSSDVKTEFNVKQHLNMLIMSLRPTYKSKPIDIILDGDDDINIHSFPGLLNQIITNLIMNSIKHAFSDNQKGQVIINLQQLDDLVHIIVEDNGIGIPEENKNKVFDPFFTTRRGTGGSGLGLNIVYNLVHQKLNGEIKLEDNQPQGSRFIVTFPI